MLKVRAVFKLEGGVLVVGTVDGSPSRIQNLEASVLLAGRSVGSLRVLSERMPGPAAQKRGERIVEVQDSLDWDAERVSAGDYQLCWDAG